MVKGFLVLCLFLSRGTKAQPLPSLPGTPPGLVAVQGCSRELCWAAADEQQRELGPGGAARAWNSPGCVAGHRKQRCFVLKDEIARSRDQT